MNVRIFIIGCWSTSQLKKMVLMYFYMTFEHNIFVLIVTDTLSLHSLIILTPLYKYQGC